jgi:hypothetical protein
MSKSCVGEMYQEQCVADAMYQSEFVYTELQC